MSNLWVASIAAGAAILSSFLTSLFTHLYINKRHKRDYELKWLEERFIPAINFISRVYAIISNTKNTTKGRAQIKNEIQEIVVGSSKEDNAWCIAILLDLEDTGLRNQIYSTMTYARIAKSKKEFTDYQIKLHWSLKTLEEEFRRERQAIIFGKSLDSLIRARKIELERRTNEIGSLINSLRNYANYKTEIDTVIRKVEKSNIRGEYLDGIIRLISHEGGNDKKENLEGLRKECSKHGWLLIDYKD